MYGSDGDYWWADRLGEAWRLPQPLLKGYQLFAVCSHEFWIPRCWAVGIFDGRVGNSDHPHLAGLRAYRPLTFLRDDLIVTRDPVAIAAVEGRLSSAERCQCRVRDSAAWVRPSPDEFTAPYDLIERSAASWNALYRCRTCGAYWVLEQGREYDRDMNVAVRVQSARSWQSVDLVDGRWRLLVEREGESERPCRWAGCSRRALKDREICVDHAYGLSDGPSDTK